MACSSRSKTDAYFPPSQLETDFDLLLTKANRAIQSYGVHVVVANLLQTRRDEVGSMTLTNLIRLIESKDIEIFLLNESRKSWKSSNLIQRDTNVPGGLTGDHSAAERPNVSHRQG